MNDSSSSLENSHFPVMLNEIVKICSPERGGVFIDCTFGAGGYSKKLLTFSKTKVIALDRDKIILKISKNLKLRYPDRFFFHHKKFSDLSQVTAIESADAIIFDLGLSSIQLKDLKRGFSFNSKDRLDMSMGLTNNSAEKALNTLSELNLKHIIKFLGEEKDASKIAKNIVCYRANKKITKVSQLVEIIEKSKKKDYKKKLNPSTKTFQALRIFVNKEITELVNGIINATKIIKPGGKILIVSFHSIEDKIVKYFFNNFSSNQPKYSRYFPDTISNHTLFNNYKNKVLIPTKHEIIKNPPSRSAKLRFAIRNKNNFIYPEGLIFKFKKYLDLEKLYV